MHNRHKRPIASHSERVFVRPNFWTRLPRSRTNPALAPMSRAELEHVLARGLEGKKIRLKNNKLRLSAAPHRAIHNSISQNGLAGYLRQVTRRAED